MLNALYVLDPSCQKLIYGDRQQAQIAKLVNVLGAFSPQEATKHPDLLAKAEVILTGWGSPHLDATYMSLLPQLKLVLYGAGTIKFMVTDAFWQRNIAVCSAWAANAIPVTEYTLSQILFCLKRGWYFARTVRELKGYPKPRAEVPGAFGSTVGIISLGQIGRRVCQLLQQFDVRVVAYDPYATPELGKSLRVELMSLEELFAQSDVVSLHAPNIPATKGMITGELLRSMKPSASFINTARGAIVREDELIAVLQKRPDLQAVLDVTDPEPPVADSPFYTLPNVALTPHIAGSMDNECQRMGQYMVEELQRYLANEPLLWSISRKQAEIMA